MASFTKAYKIRFEDVDPAGIVFYPRYILMLHRFFEDWFQSGIGYSLGTMNISRKVGFPLVNLQVSFQKPSRLEEILQWSLLISKISKKSLTLTITAMCDKEIRLKVMYTIVAVDLAQNTIISIPIPEDVRAAMKHFLPE